MEKKGNKRIGSLTTAGKRFFIGTYLLQPGLWRDAPTGSEFTKT